MLLVWGHKYQLEPIGSVDVECPDCHTSPMQLCKGEKKFTVYWMPTFTMSEGYFVRCPRCQNDNLYEVDASLLA